MNAEVETNGNEEKASSGHKLGQLVGDWYEQYVCLPLLQAVSDELDLYLDSRFVHHSGPNEKVIWSDSDGNKVDYDFVLEVRETPGQRGIPVGFIESFWRRGKRHSKDKARDDSGKLLPMRGTYPTARFLGIIGAGEFTKPAIELIRSREIELFYIPKSKVVEAFKTNELVMDYPDKLDEAAKARIVERFEVGFTDEMKGKVAESLRQLIGAAKIDAYVDRVRAALGALPQEIRFFKREASQPVVFGSIFAAIEFLNDPEFSMDDPSASYLYQVTYSDGSEFEEEVNSLEGLRSLNGQIEILAKHMERLASERSKQAARSSS